MNKFGLLLLLLLPYSTQAALPDRKNTNHADLNLQELFQKIDVKFQNTTPIGNNITVNTYSYKINALFNQDIKSYRLLHYHLRNWCEQNHGKWTSDLRNHPSGDGILGTKAIVFPSLTFTGYNSFVNVSCRGAHPDTVDISFNATEIYVTEQKDFLVQARQDLKSEQEQKNLLTSKAREKCIKEPLRSMAKIENQLTTTWRGNLTVGDTINGVNLIINAKGKELVEIQDRSSGKIYWFKRSELHLPEQLQDKMNSLQRPFQKMIDECNLKFRQSQPNQSQN